MKYVLNVLLVVGLMFMAGCQSRSDSRAREGDLTGTIAISGAWPLYPMAVKWAEEFQKLHPHVRVDVAAGGAGKGMADALAQIVDIGNVSRDIYPEELAKGAWWDWPLPKGSPGGIPFRDIRIRLLKAILFQGIICV